MASQFEMNGTTNNAGRTLTNAGGTLPEQDKCWACGGLVMVTMDDPSPATSRRMERCQKCGTLQPERAQSQGIFQYKRGTDA